MAAGSGTGHTPPPTELDAALAERHLRDTVAFNQRHAADHERQARRTPLDQTPQQRDASRRYHQDHAAQHQQGADDARAKLTNGYLGRATTMMRPPLPPPRPPMLPTGGGPMMPPPPMPGGGGPPMPPPPLPPAALPLRPPMGAGPLPLPALGTPTRLPAVTATPPRPRSKSGGKKKGKGK